MQETLFVKFLKTLNPNEIRQFRDFVNSPVFNKNKSISELLEIHCKYYPGFESEELSEKNLYLKIFGNEDFKYFKIKNLISDLFALGKEFLTFIVYKNDSFVKEKFLLSELRKRNLDIAFEKTYKNAEKNLEKDDSRDENYFFHKMNLRSEITSYHSPKMPNVNFHYLQERLELFINYSAITLLKMYNIMLHEGNQNNFNYDMKMFDNVMEYLEKNEISDNPTLEIYYFIAQLEKTRDEKYFYILKDLRKKYRDKLTEFDNYMLYLHMDSFCATEFNDFCRTDLLKEQFELVKENLMFEITGMRKILYPDFLNEVKKAVRVNEFEYAENYIEKYKDRLSEEKENTLNFCYGYISSQKGDTDKALDYFSRTNFSNFIIKIQVKIHLVQLCIEKEYYDQAELMIDTFKHYVSREKAILDVIKISVMEFLKISGDLIKIKTVIDKKDKNIKIGSLKKQVEEMSNNRFGIKLWLKEKAGQLNFLILLCPAFYI